MGDYYEILGLDRGATLEDIRAAYFDLVRTAHPDINPDPDAKERFIEIQEAYEILRDSQKRKKYDSFLPDVTKHDPLVKVTVKLSRTHVKRIDEPQLMYALMELECVAGENEISHPPFHYCFVIDRSTSMDGERMEMVKANFLKILPQLHKQDLVSIVTFSDRPEILCSSAPIENITAIEEKIQTIGCSGSTEIYKGLKAGVDLLRLGGIANPTRHLILLTDGHTYGDEEACLSLAKEAFSQGIMISAMGLGYEWNDVFLDELATCTGGSTVFVNSKEDLYNYLVRKIDHGNMIYAGNMVFEHKCDPEVKLKSAFRLQPEIMPLELQNQIPMGDIAFGSKSQFLLEFLVDTSHCTRDFVHLTRGRVKMDIYSDSLTPARINIKMTSRVLENAERENPPIEIIRALSKLTLYQMQVRNSADVGKGEYISAVKRMHYLASKLLSHGDRGLARQILIEAENINNKHRFSEEGEKRIKYGTRSLFLLPEPKPRIS